MAKWHKRKTGNFNLEICSRCELLKDISKFHKSNSHTNGLRPECKDCWKKSYLENRIKILAKRSEYRKYNKEIIRASKRRYYVNSRYKIRLKAKENYKINRESILAKNMIWRKNSDRGQFLSIRRGAILRDMQFAITFESALEFKNKPCFYCGENVPRIGIDRVNNDIGYVVGNLVTCCTICNRMKTNYSVNNFIKHCRKISEHFIKVEKALNWRNGTTLKPGILT
jgi:hypothetical protein